MNIVNAHTLEQLSSLKFVLPRSYTSDVLRQLGSWWVSSRQRYLVWRSHSPDEFQETLASPRWLVSNQTPQTLLLLHVVCNQCNMQFSMSPNPTYIHHCESPSWLICANFNFCGNYCNHMSMSLWHTCCIQTLLTSVIWSSLWGS